jgi:hypothetical protein
MTQETAHPFQRVGYWLRKMVGGSKTVGHADPVKSEAPAQDDSTRPIVVGRRTTDESGTDPETETPRGR